MSVSEHFTIRPLHVNRYATVDLGGRLIRVHHRKIDDLVMLVLEEKEHFEDALPEPEQEGALKSPVGETVPRDPGIGGLGPLPDAGPDEVEVIEGVSGEAEQYARDMDFAYEVGSLISSVRGLLDDMQHAAEAAIKDGVTTGRLTIERAGIEVWVAWPRNAWAAEIRVEAAIPLGAEG